MTDVVRPPVRGNIRLNLLTQIGAFDPSDPNQPQPGGLSV
jgi:hypothetical protein